MLRPERMSKVSVTGAKRVMDDVVDTVHGLNLLHLSNYDGSWEGFSPGDPVEGAEDASEKLVTVRSLESILDVDEADAGPDRVVEPDEIDEELERVRREANQLDDRRDELRSQLRTVEDRVDAMDPFLELGIDLDLLGGYETLDVAVGYGVAENVAAALAGADEVADYETWRAEDTNAIAAFVRPAEGATGDIVADALVGVDFDRVEIPDADGTPIEHVEQLRDRKRDLEVDLEAVEDELDALRRNAGGFLLAAEEALSIEVQKTEAPLQFATTRNSFVAEGWIPTARYEDLVIALTDAVGDHVEIEELERASYSERGAPEEREPVGESGVGGGEPTAADGGTARTDGGHGTAATMDDDPPVVLKHNNIVSPMELLVDAVGRPKYTEFDPTWLLLLSFPAFFGFMIGDLGYGIGYAAVGYLLMTRFESDGLRKLGGIGIWAGGFTAFFGLLYGEFFGLHGLGEILWGESGLVLSLGHPPIEKGLSAPEFAKAWMIVTLAAGLLHVTVGYVFSFAKDYHSHGLRDAIFESGSWIVLMIGVWGWVFSVLPGLSPSLFAETLGPEGAIPIGFMGLPAAVSTPMLALIGVGAVMLVIGEGLKAVEITQTLVNVLSYMRLMAVLLAKAGMAFVVNLFVFGLYEHDGETHFLTFGDPHGPEEIVFQGLINMEGALAIPAILVGIVVLVVGHLVVFALGITSAGLQSMRLEYVEFFGKFYDGGGRSYNPFGYIRQYTTED